MKRNTKIGTVAIGLLLSSAPRSAHAQTSDASTQADAAFNEAQRLHAAGDDAAACPKFAESKRLAPAIGVTLHLADCYAKIGKTASAWKEFRDAEKMARDKGDAKRADLAAQRAAALSAGLSRLTVEAPADGAKSGEQLQLDGAPLAPESWNTPVPVDPGDHAVIVSMPGQPARTVSVHVDGGGANAKLSTVLATSQPPAFVVAPAPAPASAPAPAPASASATASATAPTTTTDQPRTSSSHAGARWAAGGLMLAGAVGAGIGTYLVTHTTQDMVNGQLCDPHLLPHAIPEAAVAFSVGGALLLTGAVLFYANWPGRTEVSLAPSVGPGGGGAMLRGTF